MVAVQHANVAVDQIRRGFVRQPSCRAQSAKTGPFNQNGLMIIALMLVAFPRSTFLLTSELPSAIYVEDVFSQSLCS